MDYRERRRAQGAQTEQAILRSALELCRVNSFDKVSVRDICRAAGITTGAFYHHFRSKGDLVARGLSPIDAYMTRALAGHEEESIPDRLRRLLAAYAAFLEEQGWELVSRYYQLRLSTPEAGLSLDPSHFALQAMEDCLREAEETGLLAGDVTAVWASDFFFRHFRGVVIDWALHEGSYPLLPTLEQDYALFERAFHA